MFSIIIATIASMVIGGIWFGPKTLYPVMMEEMKQSDEQVTERMERFKPGVHFGLVIIAEFTLATMIYGLLDITNNDLRVILFPILFVVVSNIKTNVFSYLNIKLFIVQEGQKIISLLAMGLIISLMM